MSLQYLSKKGGTDRLSTSPNDSRLKKKSVLPGWMDGL